MTVYKKRFSGIPPDATNPKLPDIYESQKRTYDHAEGVFDDLVKGLRGVEGAKVDLGEEKPDGERVASVRIDGTVVADIRLGYDIAEKDRPYGLRELWVSVEPGCGLTGVVEEALVYGQCFSDLVRGKRVFAEPRRPPF